MLSDLRTNLWRSRSPFFEIERQMIIKMGIGSIYENFFEEMKLKGSKLDSTLHTQIKLDLKRTSAYESDNS